MNNEALSVEHVLLFPSDVPPFQRVYKSSPRGMRITM